LQEEEENVAFIRSGGQNLQNTDDNNSAPAIDDAKKVVTGVESLSAFTIFMMWQNLGSGIGFFYAIPIPMHGPGTYIQAYVQFGLLVVSLALFVLVDRKHSAKERGKM